MCWDTLLSGQVVEVGVHIHKVFHCSVWIVECCSHGSFNFRSFESHAHQFLNCALPSRSDTKGIGVIECWRTSGNSSRLRSRRWRRSSCSRRCHWEWHGSSAGLRSRCRRGDGRRRNSGSRRRRFDGCSCWFRLRGRLDGNVETTYLVHHAHDEILFLDFIRFHSIRIL